MHMEIARALLIWTLVSACDGQVNLTYPTTSEYPLDVMDVERTPGICGLSEAKPTWNGCTGSMDIVSVCAETGTACTGSGESYSHPSGRYFVSWQRDRENKNMIYTISGWLSDKERQWLALGFNYQNRMPGADAMIAWMENGKPVVSDRHITSYSQPIVDASQDVKVIAGNVTNGRTSVTFSRPLVTGDADDFNFNGTTCPYILVSWGGSVTGSGPSADLGKHSHMQSTGLRRCFTGPPAIVEPPLPGGNPDAAGGPSPLSSVGKIITAVAVLAALFLALLALAMCCRRCLAARHLRRQSQVSFGDQNGSTIGLTSPYTELSNETSAFGIDNPNYNMAPRASMTQGIYMVLPDDASALAESYGYNQSRMSSGDVLSSSQARMSSGEALGYNQTRMSSGDVLSSSQARISSGEALGYNQTGMSSGDVIDSSQAGMISAGNTQGFIQARKTSTAMFSATEHRQSSAAFLLSNGLAMTSPDAGFAHGSNGHMSSTHTGEFSQARKASTIVIDSSERRRPSEDIIEQGQADTSSSLVLGSGEQRISSGDILGANAVRSSAVYNRRQSSVVTVQTREYYSSTEPPSSIDVKYLSNALSADGKEAQYIHDEDTVSGDDVMLVVNEEPTVTKNSRYFQSTDMVSEGGAIHGRHAFGNGERAQTGAFAYVEGGDTGESSTDVNFVLMGLPAPSEDTRAFDNDMDGEPTVVTGIQTKKGSKLSTSGVTDAGYGGMETASVEKRTSSSGMETKYVFSEEHSSGGGESKYLESHGGDISGVREFDNVIDGEPTIVTGIKSKKEGKVSASGRKSSASGLTDASFSTMDNTTGERRTPSIGTEAKYVFTEKHSSDGVLNKF